LASLKGTVQVHSGETTVILSPGQFCLIPACLENVKVLAEQPASFLRVAA
jgi:hypothetical protein